MANDDEAARKARAAALRERIARLNPNRATSVEASEESETCDGDSDKDAQALNNPSDGESPREFIDRRMRELDNKT